jgi:hypothetical protein
MEIFVEPFLIKRAITKGDAALKGLAGKVEGQTWDRNRA